MQLALLFVSLLALTVKSSVVQLFVHEAFSPHRTILTQSETPASDEWIPRTSVYVFDAEEPGTVPFTYAEAQDPLRGMITPGDVSQDNWEKKLVFWALPTEQYCTCKVTVSESGENICGEDVGPSDGVKGTLVEAEGDPSQDCLQTDDTCKCTYTRGAWATNFASSGIANNHLCRWPVLPLDSPLDIETLFSTIESPTEDMILCGRTWNAILNMPVDSEKEIILAQQWIAAVLNFLNGACWDCSARDSTVVTQCQEVFQSLKDTQDRLSLCTPFDEEEWNLYSRIQNLYDNFNNGIYGPGHCGSIGVIDDKAIGRGCCTNCQRKPDTVDTTTPIYKQHDDVSQSTGEVITYSSDSDRHRMVVTREDYALADGWCPRLSFYSPCPQWEQVHW